MHDHDLAQRSGGRFILLVDDDVYMKQRLYLQAPPVATVTARMVEDLTWLGMAPSEVHMTTEFRRMQVLAGEQMQITEPQLGARRTSFLGRMIGQPGTLAQADYYHPWFTLCRVVDDAALGVDAFHRGEELIGERQLYDFLCERLKLRTVQQGYLPHVWREGATAKESKSVACTTVRELREAGYKPLQIIDTLLACSRGVSAGQQIVIPKGVLRAKGKRRWLEDPEFAEGALSSAVAAEGTEFHGALLEAAEGLIERHREALK